jgi:hypothetical protein
MENKLNTGVQSLKTRTREADNHPDYKGKVNVNGKEMDSSCFG